MAKAPDADEQPAALAARAGHCHGGLRRVRRLRQAGGGQQRRPPLRPMRAPAECPAVAPAGAAASQPPSTDANARSSVAQRRSRRASSAHLRVKRRGSSKACGRPQHRQRTRSGEPEAAGDAKAAEIVTTPIVATTGRTDQQANTPAERDSGCRNGSLTSRQTAGMHSMKTAINSTATSGPKLEAPAHTRTVMAGSGEVLAADMTDSTRLLQQQDWDALLQRLQQDGYLLLRGVLPASTVLKARAFLLEQLHAARPECFAPDLPCSEARAAEGAGSLGLLARQDLAAAHPVAAVLEAPPLFALMQRLLQAEEVVTSGYKWLRAVGRSEFTGLHTDRVFLGRGTPRLLTAWMPLGEVPPAHGSLLVAAGSQCLPAFAPLRSGYGQSQVGRDGTRSGWLSDNGAALAADVGAVDWRVADCGPGDIVVLGLNVLHMSASNESHPPCIRLSCDTRWQPAGEPRDPRLKVWRGRADCT